MPIYIYESIDGECKICGGSFEHFQSIQSEPLKKCPTCEKHVRKCIAAANVPKVNKPLSVIDAKKSGFSVLKRRDKGIYEKL